jgi:hypothetical protein
MPPVLIAFRDHVFAVDAPATVAGDIAAFFQLCAPEAKSASAMPVQVSESGDGRFALAFPEQPPIIGLSRGEVIARLAGLIGSDTFLAASDIALAAAAAGWGERAVLILGDGPTGKSSLAAWFVDNGFSFFADDSVVLGADGEVAGLPAPVSLPVSALSHAAGLGALHSAASIRAGDRLLSQPGRDWLATAPAGRVGLVVDVRYAAGLPLRLEPVAPADLTLRLLAATRRVIIPGDPGHAALVALASATPAISLTYGAYADLTGVIDLLARAAIEMEIAPDELARFLAALPAPARPAVPLTSKAFPIPEASTRRFSPKLTIGMATYDDYDGVYFSLQAMRLYHPEILDRVEFLVVDNHPDGICAEPLKALEGSIPNYRYLPFAANSGTAASRNLIFSEGGGEFALCMDCHVFFKPGALSRLLAWFDTHPDTADLLQGPLVGDDLHTVMTHFDPVWRAGMYGVWGHDPAGDDPDGAPFEIPMQGLGVFACRRAAWLGFNPLFSGFGGEEGYIHEKYRQAGHRTLCLPFLRWVHRFQRPLGPPYRNTWEDRCRNYMIGLRELNLPTAELEAHFAEVLGAENAARIFAAIRTELDDVALAAE